MRYQTPDGRWQVDVITLEHAPVQNGRTDSIGDGEQFRVRRDGFYVGSARTMADLRLLIGPSVVSDLEPVDD